MGGSASDIVAREQEVKSIESLIRDLQKQKEWCQSQLKGGITDKSTIQLHRNRIKSLNEKIAVQKKQLARAKERLREAKKKK